MAYRNIIISLSSLVALGTACSKAPSYNQNVKAGAADAAATDTSVNSEIGHGDDSTRTAADTDDKTPTTAPTTTADQKPAAPAAPGAAKTDAERAKEMNARGFVAYAVSAPNGQGWNTAQTPFLLAPSVDAAAKVDAAKAFNVYFCNFASGSMTIHSSANNGPMAHGQAFTGTGLGNFASLAAAQAELDKISADAAQGLNTIKAMTNCKAHLVSNTATTEGATYNHQGGAANNAASLIHFKMMTVDPAGVVK